MKPFSMQKLRTLELCTSKVRRIALAVAVTVALILPAGLRVARAQSGASPALAAPPNFSLVGLAFNQSLRINVVAPVAQPGFPPSPCSAVLSFLDANSNSVGPSKSANLNPGQSASLDPNVNTLLKLFGQRVELRPIAITYPPSPAYPPDPWVASLAFAGKNGNAVGPATTVSLNAGQSASLDLNSSAVITNLGTSSFALFGQHAEVRPVVTLLPTPTANACQASAEVFDTFTGRTWSYAIAPGPTE
jgi:hypothetical protein